MSPLIVASSADTTLAAMAVSAMSAVPPMHEEVHAAADEQDQQRPQAEDVRLMLEQNEQRSDRKKAA
jgi:hypothetical protein